MYGYIYITTNLINNKKYIGKKTSSSFDTSYLGSGIALQKAIKKYGKDAFKVELLEECKSLEELNNKEKYYISINNASESNEYYNIAHGGDGGILWKSPSDHPSLGKPGRVGKENGMFGVSMFDKLDEKRQAEVKKKMSNSIKKYYKENKYIYVHNNDCIKRIKVDDLNLYLEDGWSCSNSYLRTLNKNNWYSGKPCKSCGKPMTELYGSGIYCSKSCSHKRKKSEEEKIKIREGRLRYEKSLSEEYKKERYLRSVEKLHSTLKNRSEEEIQLSKTKMRNSHLGKKLSDEQKNKISQSLKKKKRG